MLLLGCTYNLFAIHKEIENSDTYRSHFDKPPEKFPFVKCL